MIGQRIGRVAKVRAALANGPLQYAELAAAIGERSSQVKRALWQMKKQGFLTHEASGWALTDKVPLPRYATKEESIAAKKAARERFAERARGARPPKPAKVVVPKAVKPPRPKPAATPVSTRKRTMEHGILLATVKADALMPVVEKQSFPSSDAFIAANPDRYERLPMGATSAVYETPRLSARERRMLNGSLLDRVAG